MVANFIIGGIKSSYDICLSLLRKMHLANVHQEIVHSFRTEVLSKDQT